MLRLVEDAANWPWAIPVPESAIERVPFAFLASNRPDSHYNSSVPMTLDEQSFQGLLSAAFTIQEHNDWRKLARQTTARQTQAEPETDKLCQQCGALMPANASRCGACNLDAFRPGERVQREWLPMWLRSQAQSLWPERSPEIREDLPTGVPLDAERKPRAQAPHDSAGPSFLALPIAEEAAKETTTQEKAETIHDHAFDTSVLDKAEAKSQGITEVTEDLTREDLAPEDAEQTVQALQLSASDDVIATDARTDAPPDPSVDASGDNMRSLIQRNLAGTERLNCVPDHVLREIVQQALQATHATGAAIALNQQGELVCRATAGDFASEIGKMINTGSGFTGVCTSSGSMQLCSNTQLDSRVDADACRKLGVSAIIVVPLLHQDQSLGLIAVFSRRPYAFGIRGLQALQDLAERFAANLQFIAESANAHESLG